MSDRPDPLQHAASREVDLQGIATWEPRSLLDRLLAKYTGPLLRAGVVLVALVLFAGELLLLGLQVLADPGSLLVVVLFPISVVPALVIAGYVWYTDVTREPPLALFATFLLGMVLATFPTVTNTVTGVLIDLVVPAGTARTAVEVAHFYLVVAPGEEVAKLAAVVAYVYWTADFDSVVDGAVYGAVAGLGFATIENVVYIVQTLASTTSAVELVVGAGAITVLRSIAGPGHVIWTALAGYYLGLAKFNGEYALPLVVKGLLIAVVLHGTYNSAVTVIGAAANALALGAAGLAAVVGFILLYQFGAFAYLFVRLRRYRTAYADASPGPEAAPVERLRDDKG